MPLSADDNCDYDSDGNGCLDRNWAADWLPAIPSAPWPSWPPPAATAPIRRR